GACNEDAHRLAESLPAWDPFPEVRAALEDARSRRWKLAILSNTDRDFIDASMARLGVPFERAIVASEIGSYKPAHRHWDRFFEGTGAPREGHVHVAQSHIHDIEPATELGLRTIWINRPGGRREPAPARFSRSSASSGGAIGLTDGLRSIRSTKATSFTRRWSSTRSSECARPTSVVSRSALWPRTSLHSGSSSASATPSCGASIG